MEADPISKVNPDEGHTEQRDITWTDVEAAVETIVATIKEKNYTVKQIFGLPRGGLIAAVMLSHKLNVPMVFDDTLFDENTLVVDDAIEAGDTMKDLLVKKPIVAILYRSERSANDEILGSYEKLIVVETKKADEWINFPWE